MSTDYGDPLSMTESRSGLFARGLQQLEHLPLAPIQLAARLALGMIFWRSGMTKIASWDITLALFEEEYRVPLLPPEIAAHLATALELTAPVLLLLGLGTRFAALALLGMVFVIQVFVFPGSWVDHLTWATLLVLLLSRGAGQLSIDHLLARRFLGRNR